MALPDPFTALFHGVARPVVITRGPRTVVYANKAASNIPACVRASEPLLVIWHDGRFYELRLPPGGELDLTAEENALARRVLEGEDVDQEALSALLRRTGYETREAFVSDARASRFILR